jgi:leader peptidase (prepilin peptidase)/N-methyltransferase
MLEFIAAHTWIYIALVILLSLIIGSFLNVIIHRLPIMLEADWRQQCVETLSEPSVTVTPYKTFNLAYPPSHCPACMVKLSIWQNIPVVSYLVLRGRCAHCQAPIHFRYILVEILCAIFSTIAAVQFGLSVELLAVLLMTWFLLVMSFVDIQHQVLPDILTIPLLWLGLFVSCFNVLSNTHDAVLGAIMGYLFLWIVNGIFKWITKKEGIGHGDFKLLAAAGAWLGWQLLPFVVLTSSVLGLVVGGGALLIQGRSKNTPIPFGPFIALSLWLGAIWGYDLTHLYLNWFGIAWSNV